MDIVDFSLVIKVRRRFLRVARLFTIFSIPLGAFLIIALDISDNYIVSYGFFIILLSLYIFVVRLIINKITIGNTLSILFLIILVLLLSIFFLNTDFNQPSNGDEILSKNFGVQKKRKSEVPNWFIYLIVLVLNYFPIIALYSVYYYKGLNISFNTNKKSEGFKIQRNLKSKINLSLIKSFLFKFLSYFVLSSTLILWLTLSILATIGIITIGPIKIAILFIGGALFYKSLVRSKKYIAPKANLVLNTDKRDPYLILRSFKDDESKIPKRFSWSILLSINAKTTLEESISRELNNYGPVIAVGKPKEALPPLGAARMYLDEKSWLTNLEGYLRTSKFIIVLIGKSNGLLQEYHKLIELSLINKVVFVFPPLGLKDLNSRIKIFSDAFQLSSEALAQIQDNKLNIIGLKLNNFGIEEVILSDYKNQLAYELLIKHLLEEEFSFLKPSAKQEIVKRIYYQKEAA